MLSDTYVIPLVSTMTPNQRDVFYAEYNRRSKDYNIALVLAIVGGWAFGLHKFYLGKPLQGLLHFLFSFTLIPLILTIIDIFNLHATVDRINREIADNIATKVRSSVN